MKKEMFSFFESRIVFLEGSNIKAGSEKVVDPKESTPGNRAEVGASLDYLTSPIEGEENLPNVVDEILNRDATAFAERFSQTADEFEKAEVVWTAKTLQNFLVEMVSNIQDPNALTEVIQKYGDRRLGGRITWVSSDGSPIEINLSDFQNSKLFNQMGKNPENFLRNTNNPNNMVMVTNDGNYDVPLSLFFKYSHRGLKSFLKIVENTCDTIATNDLNEMFLKSGGKPEVSQGFYVQDRPDSEDYERPKDSKVKSFDIKGDYSDPYSIDDTKPKAE